MKKNIKNELSIEQIEELVAEMGGEPHRKGGMLICKTICHNGAGQGSHKLYYYDNTRLFKCYTGCAGNSFDIFDLVLRVRKTEGFKIGYYQDDTYIEREWELPDAIKYVANFFGLEIEDDNDNGNFQTLQSDEWKVLKKSLKKDKIAYPKYERIVLPEYPKDTLKYYPQPIIQPWLREGISSETQKRFGIKYNPVTGGILIPHNDENNRLIGIRERTLIKENEELYGKYRPAYIHGTVFKHPLSYNLYGFNLSKNNIARSGLAIVGEGEKFCMMYDSYFGNENNISVACCGSSLISHQVEFLLSVGVKEIIIAFDKQFQQKGDKEWKIWVDKLKGINKKYGSIVKISFMFDKENLLNYKSSPIDEGKDKFLYLFQHRFTI